MEKRKIAFIHTSPAAVGPLMQFYAEAAPEGNIGPTIDAALDELGEDFTVAVPALPVNGRTTYQGYHFVHRRLLSDSPMRHHPLTPMTNPGLVELLGRQTRRRVGLAPYAEVEAGVERL